MIFILYDFICLVIEGGRDVRALREYVAAQIEEEAQKPHRLKPWPDLQPAEYVFLVSQSPGPVFNLILKFEI